MSNKVSFIGTGNVCWHLSQILEESGNTICEIYGRNTIKAKQIISGLFDCKVKNDLDFFDSEANIFVLCVSDDAMQEVLDQLILPVNSILVHTSGSVGLDILEKWLVFSENESVSIGVFYPLMTLTKGVEFDAQNLPMCIEANTELAESILVKMAQKFSKTVFIVDSEERKVLHLAAVLANNFVNHLWVLTQKLMDAHDLDMALINPLLLETAQKAIKSQNLAMVQTGPAKRGDSKIIKKHLQMLENEPDIQKVYRVLSESIFNEHHEQ